MAYALLARDVFFYPVCHILFFKNECAEHGKCDFFGLRIGKRNTAALLHQLFYFSARAQKKMVFAACRHGNDICAGLVCP
ncbi:hypothetical protein [Filimonas lacunae]|uniref:hypothetical protein n=1 Tax=Filimonas lacunae TaxID=477680 RepID=UPI0013565EB2|nr:hypothetical protein [Filimonas lacunae]